MPNTNSVNLNSRVARSEEVLTSEVDGEVVMMSIEHGTYSGLDAIGSEIWGLLENPRRVSEICDRMMERYDVERGQCEKDVLAFLNDPGCTIGFAPIQVSMSAPGAPFRDLLEALYCRLQGNAIIQDRFRVNLRLG